MKGVLEGSMEVADEERLKGGECESTRTGVRTLARIFFFFEPTYLKAPADLKRNLKVCIQSPE